MLVVCVLVHLLFVEFCVYMIIRSALCERLKYLQSFGRTFLAFLWGLFYCDLFCRDLSIRTFYIEAFLFALNTLGSCTGGPMRRSQVKILGAHLVSSVQVVDDER